MRESGQSTDHEDEHESESDGRPGVAMWMPALVIGLLLVVVGPDGGFVGGFMEGAGVALLVAAVFMVGVYVRTSSGHDHGWWLPSRDGHGRGTGDE